MTEDKTSISKASSYEEIGEFWDTHDLADYLDDSQIVDFNTSDIQSSKIYFHIETDMAKKYAPSPSAKAYPAQTC